MSSKQKKPKPSAGRRKQEKAETRPSKKPVKLERPSGSPPAATVSSRHGTSFVQRAARGFSLRELSEGGLALIQAQRWGVPLDLRRRSVVEANVSSVKKWASRARPVEAPEEPKPKHEQPEKPQKKRPTKKKAD